MKELKENDGYYIENGNLMLDGKVIPINKNDKEQKAFLQTFTAKVDMFDKDGIDVEAVITERVVKDYNFDFDCICGEKLNIIFFDLEEGDNNKLEAHTAKCKKCLTNYIATDYKNKILNIKSS